MLSLSALRCLAALALLAACSASTPAPAPTCPDQVGTLGSALCEEFAAWWGASLAGHTVTSNATVVTTSADCVEMTTTCRVVHSHHGEAVLRDTYSVADVCRGVRVTQDYTIPVKDQAGVVTTERFRARVLVPRLRAVPFESAATQLQGKKTGGETLRMYFRSGVLETEEGSVTGLFAKVERIGASGTVLPFGTGRWVLLSNQQYLDLRCPAEHSMPRAQWTYYSDDACEEAVDTVTATRPDGGCSQVQTAVQSRGLTFASVLCGKEAVFLSPILKNMSACSNYSSTVDALTRNPDVKIPLSQRGVCRKVSDVANGIKSMKLHMDSCEAPKPVCQWRPGSLRGTQVELGSGMSRDMCLNFALGSPKESNLTGTPCAVGWSDQGAQNKTRCFAIVNSCEMTTSQAQNTGGRTEYSCLIYSAVVATSKKKNDSLLMQVMMICLAVCCIILVLILIRFIFVYSELKKRKPSNVFDQDSGRREGIVDGVPVPAERTQEHDDADDECSAAPGLEHLLESPVNRGSGDGDGDNNDDGGNQSRRLSEEALLGHTQNPPSTHSRAGQQHQQQQSELFQPDPSITSNPLSHFPVTPSQGAMERDASSHEPVHQVCPFGTSRSTRPASLMNSPADQALSVSRKASKLSAVSTQAESQLDGLQADQPPTNTTGLEDDELVV